MLSLEDDGHCFACGRKNPIGLGLSFVQDGPILRARFVPSRAHQGYKGIVHGGIISTVLDEVMAQAAIRELGCMAATVEFSVRFVTPLLVGQEAVAEAELEDGSSRRLVSARATLRRASDGETLATASARLYRVSR